MNEVKKHEDQQTIDRMSIPAIEKILDAHFIPYFVKDGRIYADARTFAKFSRRPRT